MPSRAGARPSGRMPTSCRCGPVGQLAQDHVGAREAALARAGAWRSSRRARPRPGVVVGVDVVAVEAQARPPGAANRARPGRPAPPRAASSRRRASASASRGGDRDLEAVLAGVAAARDPAGDAGDRRRRRSCMKASPAQLGARRPSTAAAARPLQRQQRAVGELLDRGAPARAPARRWARSASRQRGIDDHEQTVARRGRRSGRRGCRPRRW